MSMKDKWVRRFSVDETAKHNDGFTIYKITSILFPLESPEVVSIVSVWKRYSEARRLHKSLKRLHSAMPLSLISSKNECPHLPTTTYFTRFQAQVIESRAQAIQKFLEFVAEHRLLFTSAEFVNFLQCGYECPSPSHAESGLAPSESVISQIRSSLQLPPDSLLDRDDLTSADTTDGPTIVGPNIIVPDIPIYEAADIEIRQSKPEPKLADSFESFSSLESSSSDFYDEVNRMSIDSKPSVNTRPVLPDLINFDLPSTSRFDDYHTMRRPSNTNSETSTLDSNFELDSRRSLSRVSLNASLSHSDVQSKTRTEDSYIFEAGYRLNLALRCERAGDYQKAFDCYKDGIEKMLIGVQSDPSPSRRALVKEKADHYLSHAETLYRTSLTGEHSQPLARVARPRAGSSASSSSIRLQVPYCELSLYRVLSVLGNTLMLVLHTQEQTCYVIKVVQKISNNMSEFDELVHHRPPSTRRPTLPCGVPYMVQLRCYMETEDLLLLVLQYAAGERLLDYISKYSKSCPPSPPTRGIDLRNVFTDTAPPPCDVSPPTHVAGGDVSVDDLLYNSQKLLENVDKALSERKSDDDGDGFRENVEVQVEEDEVMKNDELRLMMVTPPYLRSSSRSSPLSAASTRGWSAEILLAIKHLHLAGVICRDLNSSNILLGAGGHVTLTYCLGYPPPLPPLPAPPRGPHSSLHIAPELYYRAARRQEAEGPLCDYWSFGVILYELVCGVPLSYYHRSIFTSHTLLQFPDGVDVEAQSILTQLLTANPEERLGSGGIHEIMSHPYYKLTDWEALYNTWLHDLQHSPAR